MVDNKVDEARAKASVLQFMRSTGAISKRSALASEFVIGTTGRRADIVVSGPELVGIEIKTKYDSLTRLAPQIAAYQMCFERTVLVLDARHHAKALSLIPPSVEVWTLLDDGSISDNSGASFCHRPGRIADLLTTRQLKLLLGIRMSDKVRRQALLTLANEIKYEEMRDRVKSSFHKLFAKTTERFWTEVGRSRVTPAKLPFLSRQSDARIAYQQAAASRQDFWTEWRRKAESAFPSLSTQSRPATNRLQMFEYAYGD